MKAKLLLALLLLSSLVYADDVIDAEAELIALEDRIICKFCDLVLQEDLVTRKKLWRELLDLFCLQHELSRIIDDSKKEKNLKQ